MLFIFLTLFSDPLSDENRVIENNFQKYEFSEI